ncbi:MAG: efflux RND transporter periplasmic adaptor subunit [Gemmatimonadetes bacterium]|nr:efflux RND transporter periplasmic adaptor subunit [Gemmatimonadota bacterium]MBK9408017.1 efflux RND transporter periplasmic adaptor subunit [Gemmatimonadota bacterium]
MHRSPSPPPVGRLRASAAGMTRRLALTGTLVALAACGGANAKDAATTTANGGTATGANARGKAPIVLTSQDLIAATQAEIGDAIVLSGPLQPKEVVALRARVGGTIAGLSVDRGSTVRRGQRLATIRAAGIVSQAAGARANVAAAEANHALARQRLEAARTLFTAGAMSAIERQSAEAGYESALAQVAAAKAQETSAAEAADYTSVVSPIDGVVSARTRRDGESVAPNDEILVVVNGRTLDLAGQIGVDDAARVKVGQSVTFSLDAFPGEDFRGHVARVDPVADPGTRQVGVHVELANAKGRIVGGQYARGRIALGSVTAIVVPMTAVQGAAPDGKGGHVFVVTNGRVTQRAVTLGAHDEATGTVAVTTGLATGDQVIVTPTTDVADGIVVSVVSGKE